MRQTIATTGNTFDVGFDDFFIVFARLSSPELLPNLHECVEASELCGRY